MDPKTGQAISGLLVYLCLTDIGGKCTLRASLNSTTGDDGILRIANVPPASYSFLLAAPDPAAKIEEGYVFDFGSANLRVMAGSRTDVDSSGKLVVTGALRDPKSGLRFLLDKGVFRKVDVRIGETASVRVEVPASARK